MDEATKRKIRLESGIEKRVYGEICSIECFGTLLN